MTLRFDYIDSDAQLIAFSDKIADAPWLAIDTEFIRERTYYAELALIQITSEHASALIDPLRLSNLDPLLEVFTKDNCIKIFHSASQDLEVLFQSMGVMPCPVFDTQLAASFLGEANQISYAAIVLQRLGVALDKGQTRTNWLQRPLSHSQLNYAEEDVLYLHDLYRQLNDELASIARQTWAQAESIAIAERMRLSAQPNLAYQRLKGFSRLSPEQQQAASALATWREQRAQKANLPREWILKKQVLMDIAKAAPSSMEALKSIEGLSDKQRHRNGKAILAVLASLADAGSVVPIQVEMNAEQRGFAKKLMASLRDIATEQKIAPALIANRAVMEQFVMGEQDLDLLKGWRADIAGEALLSKLNLLSEEI